MGPTGERQWQGDGVADRPTVTDVDDPWIRSGVGLFRRQRSADGGAEECHHQQSGEQVAGGGGQLGLHEAPFVHSLRSMQRATTIYTCDAIWVTEMVNVRSKQINIESCTAPT